MLSLARDFEGLTQTALSRALGVTQGTISKYEEGILEPDKDFIDKISNLFGRPVTFFEQEFDYSISLEGHYRKKSSLPKKILRVADARMNIERIQIDRLTRGSAIDLPDTPDCDPDEYSNGPREIARAMREYLKVPTGPIQNLVEVVERSGCIVRFLDFNTLKLDGFAIRSGQNVPLIFVNKAFPIDRKRLTLAHEFGHIIMHSNRVRPNSEDEAFEFGGEFLMPEREIKPTLYPLKLEKLARLKLKWRVSMGAILQHARKIGAVNERYYRYLRTEMSKYGYNKEEPHTDCIPDEKPNLLRSVLWHYRNEFDYDIDDVAALICGTRSDVKGLQATNHEQFTVV